jgi:hypothetical protein
MSAPGSTINLTLTQSSLTEVNIRQATKVLKDGLRLLLRG